MGVVDVAFIDPGHGRGRPTGSPTLLFNLATEYLMAAKTIRPGVTTPG